MGVTFFKTAPFIKIHPRLFLLRRVLTLPLATFYHHVAMLNHEVMLCPRVSSFFFFCSRADDSILIDPHFLRHSFLNVKARVKAIRYIITNKSVEASLPLFSFSFFRSLFICTCIFLMYLLLKTWYFAVFFLLPRFLNPLASPRSAQGPAYLSRRFWGALLQLLQVWNASSCFPSINTPRSCFIFSFLFSLKKWLALRREALAMTSRSLSWL